VFKSRAPGKTSGPKRKRRPTRELCIMRSSAICNPCQIPLGSSRKDKMGGVGDTAGEEKIRAYTILVGAAEKKRTIWSV